MKLVARAGGSLRGEANIPGDKSCSHRALILGALAERHDPHRRAARKRRRACHGARGGGAWRYGRSASGRGSGRSPARRGPPPPSRSSAAIAAPPRGCCSAPARGSTGLSVTLTGDASLSKRPMRRVTAPLERMGARFEGGEHLPITVHGGRARRDRLRQRPRLGAGQVGAAARRGDERRGGEHRGARAEPRPYRNHARASLATR